MIARDEAALLAGCLESVAGVVDEIVLVDTGSHDETRDIARRAGAQVLDQPWADDFSAPRNRAIAAATGDWILQLDADERLTMAGGRYLRRAVRCGGFHCGMLPLYNATHLAANVEAVGRGEDRLDEVSYLPRLFLRDGALRYTGIIHETVRDWVVERDRVVKVLPGVAIVHYGAVADLRHSRNKVARNVRLLEARCQLDPVDPTAHGYLAVEHLGAGDHDQAEAVAERGWKLLDRTRPGADLDALRLACTRAWLLLNRGEPQRALEMVSAGQSYCQDHPDLSHLQGCALEALALRTPAWELRRAHLFDALSAFEAALGQRGRVITHCLFKGAASYATWTRIGATQLLLGRPADGLRAFDRARSCGGQEPAIPLGQAECLLSQDDLAGCLRLTKPHLSDRPDGWLLGALAAEAGGQIETMKRLLHGALERLDAGFIAPHRRERYADAICALSIYGDTPVETPGPVGQLAVLMGGQYRPVALSRSRPLDDGLARRLFRHRLLTGRTNGLEALADPRAERLLPGVGATLQRAMDDLRAEAAAHSA